MSDAILQRLDLVITLLQRIDIALQASPKEKSQPKFEPPPKKRLSKNHVGSTTFNAKAPLLVRTLLDAPVGKVTTSLAIELGVSTDTIGRMIQRLQSEHGFLTTPSKAGVRGRCLRIGDEAAARAWLQTMETSH